MLLEAKGITGALGHVKCSYRNAATVTGFRLTRDPVTKAWSLAGAVSAVDRVLLTERPLFFVVAHKHMPARWPVESFTVDGDRCTARLGAPS